MCSTWAGSASPSWAASVVLPDPAGPSTTTTRVPAVPPGTAPAPGRDAGPSRGAASRTRRTRSARTAGPTLTPLPRRRGPGGTGPRSALGPEAVLGGALLRRLELLGDAHRRRAPDGVARRERALDAQHVADARREVLGDRGEVVVGQVPELDPALLAVPHARAGDLVGHAERHALAHEPLRDVRREGEALGRERRHARRVEGQRRGHPREGGQQHLER